MSSPATATAGRQIARAAGTVMLAFIVSNLVGVLRDILIYRTFGTGTELDAFNAANRVTELLFNLVAGGALGSAFIPTFTGLLAKEQRPAAWRLASSIANITLLVLTAVSALGYFFAPQVVQYGLFVLDPSGSPAAQALTTELLRILLPSVVIFGLSGLVMGILNGHRIFWVPSVAPAMYSLGMIAGLLAMPAAWGIHRLAYGAVLGAGLHLLVQLPTLLRLGGRYRPSLDLGSPDVRQVLRLMAPRLFGVAVVQLNFIVNTVIALSLPAGSVSAIAQGFRLMLMPQAAIAQSVAMAAMPTFAAQAALGQRGEMRRALAGTLRGVLLLAVPASIGLILLRQPLVDLLYGGGQCGPGCVDMIAWALLWYAAGLVGHSLVEVLSRAFYALQDTLTPVLVGVAAMSLNVLLSFTLASAFTRAGWMPLGGLALANSTATFLEMAALITLMRRRMGGLHGEWLGQGAVKAILAGLGMALLLAGWLRLAGGQSSGIAALGGAALGAGAYAVLAAALRVSEVGQVISLIGARIKRSRGSTTSEPGVREAKAIDDQKENPSE